MTYGQFQDRVKDAMSRLTAAAQVVRGEMTSNDERDSLEAELMAERSLRKLDAEYESLLGERDQAIALLQAVHENVDAMCCLSQQEVDSIKAIIEENR